MNIWIILACIIVALIAVEFVRHYFVKYAIYMLIIVLILFVAMSYLSANQAISSDNEVLATGFSIYEKVSGFAEDVGLSGIMESARYGYWDISRNIYK